MKKNDFITILHVRLADLNSSDKCSAIDYYKELIEEKIEEGIEEEYAVASVGNIDEIVDIITSDLKAYDNTFQKSSNSTQNEKGIKYSDNGFNKQNNNTIYSDQGFNKQNNNDRPNSAFNSKSESFKNDEIFRTKNNNCDSNNANNSDKQIFEDDDIFFDTNSNSISTDPFKSKNRTYSQNKNNTDYNKYNKNNSNYDEYDKNKSNHNEYNKNKNSTYNDNLLNKNEDAPNSDKKTSVSNFFNNLWDSTKKTFLLFLPLITVSTIFAIFICGGAIMLSAATVLISVIVAAFTLGYGWVEAIIIITLGTAIMSLLMIFGILIIRWAKKLKNANKQVYKNVFGKKKEKSEI